MRTVLITLPLSLLLIINSCNSSSKDSPDDDSTKQILTISGQMVTSSKTGDWKGVNISRTEPTKFTYQYNSITSVNSSGYMLQAGDEAPGSKNNNLDGEVIIGNKFSWEGSFGASIITHGLFVGYNINSIVKYNFLENF